MPEPMTDEQRMAELLAMNPALLQPEAIELREEVKRLRTEQAERQRLSTSPARDDLTGLETLCALLHGAAETDPAAKDVAWRAFALVRAYREQGEYRAANTRMQELIVLRTKERDRLAEQRDNAGLRIQQFLYAARENGDRLDEIDVPDLTDKFVRAIRGEEVARS